MFKNFITTSALLCTLSLTIPSHAQRANFEVIPYPQEVQVSARENFFLNAQTRICYEKGDKAMKREIRIGRQNPKYYEVLEGLEPGEKVITSGYDNFGDNECLILK